jgi:hypothetical protein
MADVRQKYLTRAFLLRADADRELALSVIRNAPMDPERPLQIVVREEIKTRKPDQNALMWVGPLADIAEQGYVDGKHYAAEVLHEYFKREFLPEEFDAEQCKEGFRKWAYTPKGERVLVGSTTQLTIRGFANYLCQIEAFGASLGVRFSASPKEQSWAR